MDSVWEFLRSMTFWNWIALIAFLFFPLSALNAFLSLKSRYKDYRAIRSKKSFEKRLKELETWVNTIGTYRNEPHRYYLVVIDLIATMLIMAIEAGGCFVLAFVSITFFRSRTPWIVTLIVLCLICLAFALYHANRLLWLARHVHVSGIVKDHVVGVLSNGAKKGFLSNQSREGMLKLMFHHNLITVSEYEELEKVLSQPSTS